MNVFDFFVVLFFFVVVVVFIGSVVVFFDSYLVGIFVMGVFFIVFLFLNYWIV